MWKHFYFLNLWGDGEIPWQLSAYLKAWWKHLDVSSKTLRLLCWFHPQGGSQIALEKSVSHSEATWQWTNLGIWISVQPNTEVTWNIHVCFRVKKATLHTSQAQSLIFVVIWHHQLSGPEFGQTPRDGPLENDREAWCAAVHGVTKSWTWLSDWTTNL